MKSHAARSNRTGKIVLVLLACALAVSLWAQRC